MEVLILKGFEVNKERAEILAPSRTEAFLDRFCAETGIAGEWELGEKIWRTAGTAFSGLRSAEKKTRSRGTVPIAADFLMIAAAGVSATGFGDGVRGNGENLMATAATKARPP